jgi:hypothetical protein
MIFSKLKKELSLKQSICKLNIEIGVTLLIEKTKSLKEAQHGKIENVAGILWGIRKT